MPRILQINTVAVNGSTGRIVEGIGKCAIQRGYESVVAFGRACHSESSSRMIRIGNEFDVIKHALLTRLLDRQGLESRRATKKLIADIDKSLPDIIHLHNIHGNYLHYPTLFEYIKVRKIPLVWTLHDCWAMTGHCVHFTAVNCNKWKSACYQCPRLSSYPKSWFWDRSALNYECKKSSFTSVPDMHVVTVSDWLKTVVQESFLSDFPIRTIHNGIDVSSFYPRETEDIIKNKYNLNGKFVILGVATGWSRENGLYEFIELSKRLPDSFAIVLVGVDDSVKSILPKGIIGINRTDSVDELAMLYSAADIFINGSFEETFGLVTAEALACGTPVIVYDSTACAEIVNSKVGYIVPVGDLDQIIDCIYAHRHKLEDEIEQQSKFCAEYAATKFDRIAKFNEYINLYDEILNRS